MTPDWTRQPLRVFQHLLREVDAVGLDPERLIDEAADMSADTYLAMCGGFSAWYPTGVAAQPVNPLLEGDVVGGVCAAAKKRGMRVILRMDISKGRPGSEKDQPDWFVRDADGAHPTIWEMPQACPTGPIWQETNFAILDELLSRYDFDGLFYNYFYTTRCHCARCAAKVRAETGEGVPDAGVRSPRYERWRQRTIADYTAQVVDFVAQRNPQVAVVPYHHVRAGWDLAAMAGAAGIVSSQISNPIVPNPVDPQPVWSHWAAEEALLARAVKPDAAPILIQSTSGFFASRQTALPAHRLVRNMMLAAAHGAGTAPAVNGPLDQDDPRFLPALRRVTRYLANNADWYRGLKSCARVTVIRSEASLQWGADKGVMAAKAAGIAHRDEFRGAMEIMSALRRPAAIVAAGMLERSDLGRYACIVAPAVSCLSDADAAALDAYVAQGGTLLATGNHAGADEWGTPRTEPAMRAIPHLPSALRSIDGAYFELHDEKLQRAFGLPHLGATGRFCGPEQAPADVRTGLRLIGPFANNAPEFTVVSRSGTQPAMLSRSHGSGQAVWLPWFPAGLFHRHGIEDYVRLLEHIVAEPAGPAPIVTDASAAVDFTFYRHPRGHVLHALNGATAQDKPLAGLVRLPGFRVEVACAARRAIRLDTGEDLSLEMGTDRVAFALPGLENHAVVALLDEA